MYAARAMKRANAQFHDAHTTYNKRVRESLDKLRSKLDLPDDKKCPVCGKENRNKTRPPFGLVSRLNFISSQHRQMLAGLGRKTSGKVGMIRKGYFTSSRVKKFYGV